MQLWWDTIPLLEKIFFVLAMPATLILLIQTILLLFGGGAGDSDLDSDVSGLDGGDFDSSDGGLDGFDSFDGSGSIGDFDHPHDAGGIFHSNADHDSGVDHAHPSDHGLRIFTIRGIMGFFAVGCWAGIACMELGTSSGMAVRVALALGLLAIWLVAVITQQLSKLQENGTIQLKNAIGQTGTVYIPIPARMAQGGKINLVVQERYVEFDAVTSGNSLPTGTIIRVTDIINGSVMVVEPDER